MAEFKQVVKDIKNAEKNVDKVLRAGHLQRHESGRMSDARFDRIVGLIEGTLFGAGMLAFFAMFCHCLMR